MIIRSFLSIVVLLGLVLAGYTDRVGSAAGSRGVLRGTVTYRERVALPSDAVVEVWITDVSPLILAVPIIAETTVLPKGRQVPIPFELRYDPSRIEPDHTYAVNAAIKSGGRIMFATKTGYPVITQGNPARVDLILVRANESASATNVLLGTAWRLISLAGAAVLDRVEVTLEFPESGRVGGSGSCNRFFGTVKISGESITFGPLASTRMACAEAVARQEERYLKALEAAVRFAIDGSQLVIHAKGMDKPLRFSRMAR